MALNTLPQNGVGGHPILTLNKVEWPAPDRSPHPCKEQLSDSEIGSELQQFEAALYAARNRWDIARRRNGMFSAGRITRQDADRQLRLALAALEGGAL